MPARSPRRPSLFAARLVSRVACAALLLACFCGAGRAAVPAPQRSAPRPSTPPRVVLERKTVAGVPVKVITVNLNAPEVHVAAMLSANGPGSAESFGAMMLRAAPSAAITGTFFATSSLLPIGDIVIDGQLAHYGGFGAAFCLGADPETGATRATIRPTAGKWRRTDWTGYDSVLAGGMWLVRGGTIFLVPRAQGFHDPSLFRPNPRVAVGITRSNKLLLVATGKRVTLRSWAAVLKGLGAMDALNLDGGSSTGMYFQGWPVIRPGRHLTNALVVYTRRDAYERARAHLAPGLRATASARGVGKDG